MLEVVNVRKEYPAPGGTLTVLRDVSFALTRGDAAAVVGPSGSGKSSLLYILGGLEPPNAGHVRLDGQNLYALSPRDLASFRNQHVGFVFQDHCLLPQCSVLENVLTPTLVADADVDYVQRARLLLEQVGLSDRLAHRPAELSGGEKQRVALARALVCEPTLLLCDEPTGSLDRASAEVVTSLLLDLHARQKTILLVVTHNLELAARFGMRFELRDQTLRKV